jgi:hypothetical protein
MKQNKRFIQSVISTAKTTEVDLPWTRGKRRQAFVSKRSKDDTVTRRTA